MKDEIIISMRGITKSFGGVHALENGNLELRKGEILGLIGENGAGKSTLMNILIGIHQPDSGTITYKGETVQFKSPAEALNRGIAMIHQEISLVPELNVAENIWLGQESLFRKGAILDNTLMLQKTIHLLNELNISLDITEKVANLSIANLQLIEVARAISLNADVIIMDEPTSALTVKEIDLLYEIVRHLSDSGVSIVFISHKLPELFRFCDRLTIMRDGAFVKTCSTAEIDNNGLLKLIVGKDNVENFYREGQDFSNAEVALEVSGLGRGCVFEDISFKVHRGEVLGFSGLMGAGRTEIMNAIFGIDKFDSGSLYVFGKESRFRSPSAAMKAGLGKITEDRLRTGTIRSLSVLQNATIICLNEFLGRLRFISKKKEYSRFSEISSELMLKYGSYSDGINSLSGGNQQKVIFMRWMMPNCSIMILDEPTRGIDVGAKTEIYKIIDRLSKEGIAVLLVSSEMPELLALCDRICVIRDGRLVFECPKKDATQEVLIQHAFGA